MKILLKLKIDFKVEHKKGKINVKMLSLRRGNYRRTFSL